MRFLRSNTAVLITVGPFPANVRPTRTIHDAADIATIHVERVCNRLMRLTSGCSFANRSHLIVSQHSVVMILAFFAAMIRHIAHITSARIPSQILQVVVAGISIGVAGRLAHLTRANESLQYKMMHIASAPTKHDDQPTIMSARRTCATWFKGAPLSANTPSTFMARPDRSIGPNTIAQRIGNRSISNSHLSIISQMVTL